MSLTQDDLQKIGNLIDAPFEMQDAKLEKRFVAIEMKLEQHDKRFDNIDKKLDQLIKTENEDILAVFKDLQGIKTRLKKANI